MGIGQDIKGALVDVGSSYTILRDSGNISGEYLDFEINKQVTKPFIREFFLEVTLPHDTSAIAGDVIQFDTDQRRFLLMNKTPEEFEDEVAVYETVLYKCNVSGELLRYSGENWDRQTYRPDSIWETIKSDCSALLTENLFGTGLVLDEEIGQLGLELDSLYIPTSIGTKLLDRYSSASGEYYKIISVESRKFDGVDVCKLEEDTRE